VVPDLLSQAEQNRRRSRISDHNIEFVCAHAATYAHYDSTVLFMFHPFGEETVLHTLRNLENARRNRSTRALRVIYLNPVFDHVLKASGWLRSVGQVPASETICGYQATYWQCLG
jgi:hypothetical protein